MDAIKELMEILHRANYDDRCEKIGKRLRDIMGAALEGFEHRTRDPRILSWALRNLPSKRV